MTETHPPYPVRVDASMDAPLSRWLWLVKWFLLIPHYVVLAFLWVAFMVLTVVAWFAILVTGRYPRALFDFDVGVLRWSWRVHYYGYGALGTDRYPPFTLADVPDYPARLDVPYPERLSRGLVLVKSWLLALPHLLVVALFAGGGLWISTSSTADAGVWDDGWGAGGLVGLLVLIAGVVLLFSGRYPQPVYDFVLGMDRWVLRVAAYVALMTDRYPPFRMDMGGADPGSRPVGPSGPLPAGPAAAPVPTGAVAPQPPRYDSAERWTAGRVVAVVAGAVLLLAATGPLVGGIGLAWADTAQREDGHVWSATDTLSTSGHALTVDDITLDTAGEEWVVDEVIGDVRVEATAVDPSTGVFVGVARAADVDRYLAGVAHRQVDELDPDAGSGTTGEIRGGPPASPPGQQDFWAARTEGTGTQTLRWTPTDGDWTVVVMRADGSAGVDVDARAGVTVPALTWIWVALLVVGGVLAVAGALLVGLAVHRARPAPPGPAPTRYGPPPWPAAGPAARPPAPRPAPADAPPVGTNPGTDR
ncbi:DUF4389 domain-containing protein [Geodermatophilus sp. DSM 45219]|uniref:DUF4389 domain-containing protein n=1 Tax=Geodermatophilus sp. DSM 45219 TaxID=1881103 RepID=UPI0008860237|nr:DUF4389 domain-containing protein [Geodermatophilus sp. DSM 45219]SDO19219.1 protein of unknown function [Geodermatophilus sp. DSM 45219]